MRVAVTAKNPDSGSPVDSRFGRAKYIIIVDTLTGAMDIQDNEVNLNALQGAGIQTAQNVSALGVDAVLTGHIGPNAFRALSAAGIKVYTKLSGSVNEAIDDLVNGKLVPTESADVEGHW